MKSVSYNNVMYICCIQMYQVYYNYKNLLFIKISVYKMFQMQSLIEFIHIVTRIKYQPRKNSYTNTR